MKKKLDLKKLRKAKDIDELEVLFNQFEKEYQQYEGKLVELRKTLKEVEAQYNKDEDGADEQISEEGKNTAQKSD